MGNVFLGIDLGTSSVKMVLVKDGRVVQKSTAPCDSQDPEGWIRSIRDALKQISGRSRITAAGLSSQTGTYIVNEKYILPWSGKEGQEELKEIRERFTKRIFCEEIGMNHPSLTSYPLPKLLYSQRNIGSLSSFCQPKDLLYEYLTGSRVSDPYTWRGLASIETGTYSSLLLDALGIPKEILPPLVRPWDCAGVVSSQTARKTGLPEGIPVYAGINDYYAALLGMGVSIPGDWFDITGTSEHIGRIENRMLPDTGLVSGPYLEGNVHYGVTASTGAALSFGKKVFGPEPLWEDLTEEWIKKAPVFRPYLKGRRSPEADPLATGSFIGIRAGCTSAHMAYAVLEGVVFSLYHIYETIVREAGEMQSSGGIRVCGGASVNPLLNHLKAELFGQELWMMEEKDASAFGAALCAMIGEGALAGPEEASSICRVSKVIHSEGALGSLLEERYQMYLEK